MSADKFTYVEEGLLADEVGKHPCLYDPKCELYKNHAERDRIWKSIAGKLNKSELACKARWRNLRDTYKKARRLSKRTGTSNHRNRNPVLDQLQFLNEIETFRRPWSKENGCVQIINGADSANTIGNVCQENLVNVDDSNSRLLSEGFGPFAADAPGPSQSDTQTIDKRTIHRKGRKRRMTPELGIADLLEVSLTDRDVLLKKIIEASRERRNLIEDEVDSFCHTIGNMLKRFPPLTLAHAKAEIFSLISQLEIKMRESSDSTTTFHYASDNDSLLSDYNCTDSCDNQTVQI